MNSKNHDSSVLRIPRRTFIRRAAALTGATAVWGAIPRKLFAADDKPVLVNSIRSLANPYHATWNQGGADFAKSVGCEYVTLVTEGNSKKGIADVRAIVAKTGGNLVLNVDPNDSPDARAIVEACVNAKAHVVTQWNKPDDLHPQDFNPYYVCHILFNGVTYGSRLPRLYSRRSEAQAESSAWVGSFRTRRRFNANKG